MTMSVLIKLQTLQISRYVWYTVQNRTADAFKEKLQIFSVVPFGIDISICCQYALDDALVIIVYYILCELGSHLFFGRI